MNRSNKIIILTLIFIAFCVIAAIYLSQPSFQQPEGLPETQRSEIAPSSHRESGSPKTHEEGQTEEQQKKNNANDFCLGRCPVGMPESDAIVVHHILELSNNPKTKFADWVAYKITQDTLGKGCKRTWERDPDLDPDTTLSPSDYRGIREALQSDRGHQAPLASLCGSVYWQEADYLSNITPQKSALNEGVWEHLEDHERKLISDHIAKTVYSITGPLYEREMPSLPRAQEEHRIPSGYWKIISIRKGNNIESASFIMDQEAGREDDYCAKEVSLAEVEHRAHLRFFSDLANNARAAIEQRSAAADMLNALGCE